MKHVYIFSIALWCYIQIVQGDPAEDCMKELGFTKEVPDQNVTCFDACMEVKKNNLNPDFTINVDFQLENLKKALKPDDIVQPDDMKVVLTKCKDVAKGKHICEIEKIIGSCLMKELKHLPIEKPT